MYGIHWMKWSWIGGASERNWKFTPRKRKHPLGLAQTIKPRCFATCFAYSGFISCNSTNQLSLFIIISISKWQLHVHIQVQLASCSSEKTLRTLHGKMAALSLARLRELSTYNIKSSEWIAYEQIHMKKGWLLKSIR